MVFPFELGLSHICFPSTQSVTLRSHAVFPRSHITRVPLARSTGRLRAVFIRHDKQCNISGQRGIWRGAGASASHSTQRLQLRPVMDVARPLKIPGDENHWDWKWAEAIFYKGAGCSLLHSRRHLWKMKTSIPSRVGTASQTERGSM